jgi:hemolysin activation/secretion protein
MVLFMPNSIKNMRAVVGRQSVAGLGLAGLTLLGMASATAQTPMPQATGATTEFKISGFELTGDIPLKSEDTTRVLAPFIGPQGTLLTLQQASSALEAELSAKGFSLHRVALPPQEVGSKVTLNIVKFVIGKVTIEGASRYSEANIRASVPELKEGEAPNFKVLAVQTAIANEGAGKQIQISLKEAAQEDKIDVKVLVKEAKPWNFSASLSNTGSEATGQDRLSLVGGHSNVWGRDHQFSGAYTTSVERAKDVTQLGLNYRIPLYAVGGVVGLSHTRSDVVGSFGAFSSTGAGQTFGVNYSHYLPPAGGQRSYLTLALDDKLFKIAKINDVPVPGQLDRRSRPVTLGYTKRVESDRAVWGYNAELALNLPGGSGNDLAAYRTEDTRVQRVDWRALRGAGNYSVLRPSGWLWSVRGQFQYSPDALISGEQFGLGGAASVRGTGERVLAGDKGLFASAELSTPELRTGLRLFGFMDTGWLNNNGGGVVPTKPESDQLISGGLGVRYGAGLYNFSMEWGRLVVGSVVPVTVGSNIPQAGDEKVHLNFSARF